MNFKYRFRKWLFNIRFLLETLFATFLKSFLPGINLELSSLSKTNTTFSESSALALSKLTRLRLLLTMDLVSTFPSLRLSKLISLLTALMHRYFFNIFPESSYRKLFKSFLLLSTATLNSAEFGVSYDLEAFRGQGVACDLDCSIFFPQILVLSFDF